MKTRILCASLLLLAACGKAEAPKETPVADAPPVVEAEPDAVVPTLEKSWVAEGFASPEGVALANDGAYFISNVVGEGRDKDGQGWIARVAPNGEIIEERFAEGLDAPKGMALLDGELYVTDIDQIRVIDALSGAINVTLPVEGAGFLNDATVWNGKVYVSDSANARIYVLTGTQVDVWLEDEKLGGVNGLLGDGERMLVSTMTNGYLLSADAEGNLTQVALGMASADGIGIVPGGYLVSSWPGQIWFVDENGNVTELVNTLGTDVTQNDLTVFGGTTVIVPNWRANTVTAWEVVTE